MAASVVCPGVLLVVANPTVARQAAWHLAISNSKVSLEVTAVPWAHIKWAKTRWISRGSRASRVRCLVLVRIVNRLPAWVLKDQVQWARIPRGHKGNPAIWVCPPCVHNVGANLDSKVDQKEEG